MSGIKINHLFCIPLSLHYHWLPPKLLSLGFSQIKLTYGPILTRLSKDKVNFSLPSLLQNLENHSLNRNFAPRKETLYKIGTKNEYIGIYFCRETAES